MQTLYKWLNSLLNQDLQGEAHNFTTKLTSVGQINLSEIGFQQEQNV